MTSSNNVNIDLRPGTRLIRETRGGREVMWVEDDTIFGMPSHSSSWFWTLIIAVGFIIFGTSLFDDSSGKVHQNDRNIPASIQR